MVGAEYIPNSSVPLEELIARHPILYARKLAGGTVETESYVPVLDTFVVF